MTDREEWHGTSSELLDRLSYKVGRWVTRGKEWPMQPNYLSRALNRLITSFRNEGIEIESDREGGSGNRILTIKNINFGSTGDNSEAVQQEDTPA